MPNEPPEIDQPAEFADVEELTSFARDYFAADFPNPTRTGCPTPSELETFTNAGRIPDDHLRQHLFKCSECFRVYRRQLSRRENEVVRASSFWQSLFAARPLVAASAFALVIIAGVGILYFREQRARQFAAANDPGHQNQVTSSTTPQAAQSPELPIPAVNDSIRINFDDFGFQRGGNNGDKTSVEVSPIRTHFLITLPQSSPAGKYLVKVDDAFGKTVRQATANSVDGQTVTAEIDLTGLAQRKYWLCVSRVAESPHCYPISVR